MRDGAAALGWSFTTLSRNADPAVYSPDTAGYIGSVTAPAQSSTFVAPISATP
jgi:hypothetical protein